MKRENWLFAIIVMLLLGGCDLSGNMGKSAASAGKDVLDALVNDMSSVCKTIPVYTSENVNGDIFKSYEIVNTSIASKSPPVYLVILSLIKQNSLNLVRRSREIDSKLITDELLYVMYYNGKYTIDGDIQYSYDQDGISYAKTGFINVLLGDHRNEDWNADPAGKLQILYNIRYDYGIGYSGSYKITENNESASIDAASM